MTDTTPSLTEPYDHAFELRLIPVVINAIKRASTVNGVEVLRSAETAGALLGCLAHFMCLAGCAESDEMLERSVEGLIPLLLEHVHAAKDRLDARTQAGRA